MPDGWDAVDTGPSPPLATKKLSLSLLKHRQSGPMSTAPTSGRFAGQVLDALVLFPSCALFSKTVLYFPETVLYLPSHKSSVLSQLTRHTCSVYRICSNSFSFDIASNQPTRGLEPLLQSNPWLGTLPNPPLGSPPSLKVIQSLVFGAILARPILHVLG